MTKNTSFVSAVSAAVKVPNYTEEQTIEMTKVYLDNPSQATVELLAESMGKTVRSVIAKLSREKVYVAKQYVSKTGEKVEKKDSTATAIGSILNLSENDTSSLAKANKVALQAIFEALANSKPL
jgi:hypothetical protein